MNRPLLVVALSTLALAACSPKQEATPPALPAAVAAPAPVAPASEASSPAAPDAAKPAELSQPATGEPKLQPK